MKMATKTWLCTPNHTDNEIAINDNDKDNNDNSSSSSSSRSNSKSNNYSKKNNSNNKLIATTNLVSSVSSTRIVFLIFMLSAQFTHSLTLSASASQPTMATSSQQHLQRQNTLLSDEIEHEELIESESNQPHIRKKRLIWITDDGRLALPPGTSLTITPTLALPLVRHPPEGFFSNMSISFPLTIDFDKLGLTDNQNPLGDFPPLFARSFGHAAGEMLGNYVARYLHYKRKRDLFDQSAVPSDSGFHIKREPVAQDSTLPVDLPELPDRFRHIFHGGERVMLYVVVEDFLSTFGMDGRACLLRTICEIHSRNLDHFGVFGEMAKLFLTVTKSPFADLIPEYVQAQEIGQGRKAPGECYPYYKDCPKSIFKAIQNNKYSKQQNHEYHEEQVEEVDAYPPLPEQRLPDPDPSLNEIQNHRESLFPHSLSM